MAYKLSGVVLDGGLDFRSPKSLIKPGYLLDCQNYEVVDRSGYRRVDGFFRFSGNANIVDDRIYVLDTFSYVVDSNGDRVVDSDGEYVVTGTPVLNSSVSHSTFGWPFAYLYAANRFAQNFPFGIMVGTDGIRVYYMKLNPEYEPRVGDAIQALGYTSSEFYVAGLNALSYPLSELADFDPSDITTPTGVWSAVNSAESTVSSTNLNGYFRQIITSDYWYYVHAFTQASSSYYGVGSLPITGMHWFDDRNHIITDAQYLVVDHLQSEPKAGDTFYLSGYTTGSTDAVSRGQVLYAELVTSANWTTNNTTTARIWYRKTSNTHLFNENNTTQYDHIPIDSDWGSGLYGPAAIDLKYDKNGATFATTAPTGYLTSSSGTIVEDAPLGVLWRTFNEVQGYAHGALMNIIRVDQGSGYTRPPVVAITDSGGGYGATAYATLDGSGRVANVILLTPGRGYTSATTVTISGGGGSGATATAVVSDWRYAGTRYVDTGWTCGFTAGSQKSGYIPKINRSWNATSQNTSGVSASTPSLTGTPNRVVRDLDFPGTKQGNAGIGNWLSSSGTFTTATSVQADDSEYIKVSLNSTAMNSAIGSSATFGFVNFGALGAIPENAVIKGLKVTARIKQSATISSGTPSSFTLRANLFKTTNADDYVSVRKETLFGTSQTAAIPDSTSYSDVEFGGDGDLWGYGSWTYDDIRNENFGVALDLTMVPGSSTFSFNFQLDTLELTVYYQQPSSRYYFKDGAGNIIQADLVDYDIASGSLASGDAVGTLQLANVVPLTTVASNVHTIISTMKMYGDAACATTEILTVSSDMAYNGLPSRQDLLDNNSRFVFETANFDANKDHLAMYGASGAGRAFMYDGNYFQKIYAINSGETNSSTKDKPRHLGVFRFKLALGYDQGSVLLSSLGEPTKFSAREGAVEIGIGERITGLCSLQGTYMAVFTNNAIYGVQGDQLITSTISPKSGAIDYTVVNVGDRVLFCDSRGISTLDQSDKYGDFEGSRLSHPIAPWILPRLSLKGSTQSGTVSNAIAFAYPVRSKNQYRVWFKDGTQLVMTLVGAEQEPQFTFLNYVIDWSQVSEEEYSEAATTKHYPLALTSEVDTFGQERIFFGTDVILLTTLQQIAEQRLYLSAVFEIDKFSGFDTVGSYFPIPAHVTLNHYFADNPFLNHNLRTLRLEGSARSDANIFVSTGKDYTDPQEPTSSTVKQDVSLPNPGAVGIGDDYKAISNITSVTEEGRNILMRFDNAPVENALYTAFGPTPVTHEQSHYLQLLLLQIDEAKDDA